MKRKMILILVSVSLYAGHAMGQTTCTGTTGQPCIQGSSGPVASTVFVDATQFVPTSGTNANDACVGIAAAIAATASGSSTYGVVDARGFVGPQICSQSMFPTSTPPTGKLLLGNAVFYVQTPQVQPTRFQVQGTGWRSGNTDSNTVIRACVSSQSVSQCNGHSFSGAAVWCWGVAGTCNGNNFPGDTAYGSLTQYMSFDCNGLQLCTDMQAYDVGEGSGCWHCIFHGWASSGSKGLAICNGTNAGCANSTFEDLNVTIDQNNNSCTTNAVPIIVNSGGFAGPKFIKGVTVATGHNCQNTTYPYDSFRFSSEETSLEDVLVCQKSSIGLRVGADGPVNDVTIRGVQSGECFAQSGAGSLCDTDNSATTATVVLDGNGTNRKITNTTLISIGAVSPPANDIIRDCRNNITIKSGGNSSNAVAQYTVGPAGLVFFDTGGPVNLITSPATFDLALGYIQQYACTVGGGIAFTTANLQPGAQMEFVFVQAATGSACTVTYPSNMHGAATVSPTLGSTTTQKFIVSNGGTDLYAVAGASICTPGLGTTCGTP